MPVDRLPASKRQLIRQLSFIHNHNLSNQRLGIAEVGDMNTTILILWISLGSLLFAENPQTKEQPDMATGGQSHSQPRTLAHAKAKITVQRSEAKPYDQTGG